MAWKDWTTGTKVIVAICALVSLAVIATFAVVLTRPEKPKPTIPPAPPPSASSASPTPSPSPTYACTTAKGPDCTKELSEKESARDKTIADAEAGYRAFMRAYVEQFRAGSGTPLTDELRAATRGSITQAFEASVQRLDDEDLYFEGDVKVKDIRVSKKSPKWPTNAVTFEICQDSVQWRGIERSTRDLVYPGSDVNATTTMLLDRGRWRVDQNDERPVEEC